MGGNFRGPPDAFAREVSPGAAALLSAAFADVPAGIQDFHVHLVGTGTSGSGAYVNPRMFDYREPVNRVRSWLYLGGAGVDDLERSDEQYRERLIAQARSSPVPVRIHLLAFDYLHGDDGKPDPERSTFHAPNDYAFNLAAEHPDLFVPTISVHPYRADAVDELARWAERGVRMVKWLPNAHAIDPNDPRIDPYYDYMAQRGMVLLVHGGSEFAVEADELQELGNPLRLRRALDRGVAVVVAHCASAGLSEDLDHPGTLAPSFELFLRMMAEPRYQGLLFGEISALTQWRRLEVLEALLDRPELHARLVDGSDYPLPGVNSAVWTWQMWWRGMITWEERGQLNEIYAYNPLLFEYAIKRTIRSPKTGAQFPASIFEGRALAERLDPPTPE
jgi:predicted TIM-barrel fold metal-dependent hydrolase